MTSMFGLCFCATLGAICYAEKLFAELSSVPMDGLTAKFRPEI
jgi:hypothetical protein